MQRISREGGYFEKEVGWVNGSHAKRENLSQWLSKSLTGPGWKYMCWLHTIKWPLEKGALAHDREKQTEVT